MPARVHALNAGTSAQPCSAIAATIVVLGDRVAGADLRGRRAASASRRRPPAGASSASGGAGQRPADAGPQRRVRAGVADQHAAEQGLRVVGEHQLRVDPGGRVGERDVQAARVAPCASPNVATSTPSSLSLVDGVRAREGRRAAEQPVGDHLGHRVAGRDQAVAAVPSTAAHSPIA